MQLDYVTLKKEMLEEFALKGLSAEKQEELLGNILETLMKKILADTLEKLGDAGVAEYEKILESQASEEEIARFLNAKIPNYEGFVRGIIDAFKVELKAAVA